MASPEKNDHETIEYIAEEKKGIANSYINPLGNMESSIMATFCNYSFDVCQDFQHQTYTIRYHHNCPAVFFG